MLLNAFGEDEKRAETQKESIPWREMWGSFAGAVQDQQLMFDQQGLCGNSTNTAWSHEPDHYGKQMGHEYEEIPHGLELYPA